MFNTEGVRYSGSKKSLLPDIFFIIYDLDFNKVLDAFSGTTHVSQFFKKLKKETTANDLSSYSKIFAECYLLGNIDKKIIKEKIDYLNNLKGYRGWFSEHYGGEYNDGCSIQKDGKKRIWQFHNTEKLDIIRDEIDVISSTNIEKSILLTSLILALDKVDNTLGHQVSFLKNWSNRSYKMMNLLVPNYIGYDGLNHSVLQQDVFSINDNYDLVYLDPPYGTSNLVTKTTRVRYASYYHVWNTIVKNDKPIVLGASNRREDVSSDKKKNAISVFESTDLDIVISSFNKLFELSTKYFLLSYNNKGKVPIDILIEILKQHGKIISIKKIKYKENIQTNLCYDKSWKNEESELFEYLFLVKK